MKLVRFVHKNEKPQAGLLENENVYGLATDDILDGLDLAKAGQYSREHAYPLNAVKLLAPTPQPPSFRDFFAFEQHVANARRTRGADVPPEWYSQPVFYFSNPFAFYGPNENVPYPPFTNALDLECEVACVISQNGRNIKADQAQEYIAGFMILNDWSARDVQRTEMAVGLGPAKAKDFATSIGPYLVTPDELADRYKDGRYDLATIWRLNGQEKYRNNLKTQHFSFAECIERASQNAWIRRGDVIGSGTVGNGCLLEEGSQRERYLQIGDRITLEIERLGILETLIGEPE